MNEDRKVIYYLCYLLNKVVNGVSLDDNELQSLENLRCGSDYEYDFDDRNRRDFRW